MKKVLLFFMLFTAFTLANFDFKTCSGSGTFEQQINHYNGDYENAIKVGEIPKGIKGLEINLISSKDVDIRLYADNGDKIVHWPNGILSGSTLKTKPYKNIDVTYSGFNGTNSKRGHEFIKIPATTPTKMIMKAFGYQAGYATVNYSWTGKEGCKASTDGSGSFTQKILRDKTNLVGTIPAGIENVYIKLISDKDLDIQLYGKDGTAIVSWKPEGLIAKADKQTVTYNDMQIEWSGYNGMDGKSGHEYIKISNKTSEMLTMKVYGYEAGDANVTYSWGKVSGCTKEYVPVCGITNPCPAGAQCLVLPIYKTFSNMCVLEVANAEFAYDGKCKESNNTQGGNVVESKLKRNLASEVTTAEKKSLAQNNNDFAFEMFDKLKEKEKENIFFSPYSISEALAMVYAGAKGETKSQMEKALHFKDQNDEFHNRFNALDLHLNHTKDEYTLSVANSIWPSKDFTFLDSYLDTIKVNYGASLRLLDYANETEKSRQIINSWVEEKTHDRIKNIIPTSGLSPLTKLTLVNAIYFKASWENKFQDYMTKDDIFTKNDGTEVEKEFMHQRNNFRYAQEDDFKAIELPYSGNRTSMVIILPQEGKYNEVMKNINSTFKLANSKMVYEDVELKLPKFEFTTKLYELKEPFKKLGMVDAFEGSADFSAMSEDNKLNIDSILHKAFIKVDENGSEAAAATVAAMGVTSAGPLPVPVPPKEMFVNRPFLFFIKDIESDQILFMGLIEEPKTN